MTLKTKILAGYAVAFILMMLVVLWSVLNLVSLGKASNAILSENYQSILAAENMVDALERQDSAFLLMLLGEKENALNQLEENERDFLSWLSKAKANVTIQGESSLLEEIELAYTDYLDVLSLYSQLSISDTAISSSSLNEYKVRIHPQFAKIRNACIRLRTLNETTMYVASVEAERIAERATWSTVLVAFSGLVLAFFFSLFLAERIAGPVRRFMQATRMISDGDYGVHVPVETKDELGALANEFNRMTKQLARYHAMNIEKLIVEKTKAEAILSSIDDALIVFDTSLQVVAINPSARKILNIPEHEETRLRCRDLLPDQSICAFIEHSIVENKLSTLPEDCRFITLPENNTATHYMPALTAIRDASGSTNGIILSLRDVTHLKELERLKSEFFMAASHELRTPLTSLAMSVDLLLTHATSHLGPGEVELLRAAHEEVHRLKVQVHDLLDLSKMEAGRIQLEFQNVEIRSLFERVHRVFKSQLEMKQVALVSVLPEEMLCARADGHKIAWVLTNLISNALRYVQKDGHIKLSAEEHGGYVRIWVEDDGPGIADEYQSRIFQKFMQIEGDQEGGTGLGLAICKEIVSAHGGTIWVESSKGRGSTFTFTLPCPPHS